MFLETDSVGCLYMYLPKACGALEFENVQAIDRDLIDLQKIAGVQRL